MKRLLLYFMLLPILCTSCWYLEYEDPYPSVPHPDYKSVMYYTTTDGLPINITNPDSFGIDIIEMTYADGEGTITFDGIARHIGYKAFSECENLKSVILPDSIRIIDDNAFYRCTNLDSIT
ncbi:MAG: leucine-rich repeat protein, partial [Alistipes sp.]|nr:leucine-rich repeat protein [Alistipes sp.]